MASPKSTPAVFLTLLAATSCLISAAVAEKPWPYNLPPHQKYWPEHEVLARRHVEVQERMATQTPVGMRKMSDDPGEMFFLDYWRFEEDTQDTQPAVAAPALRLRALTTSQDASDNTTFISDFLPPFLPHAQDEEMSSSQWSNLRFLPRNVFDKRNFQCPAGTSACTSIDRPDSCCDTSETCVIITDTGLGDVGCCPNGQTCAGSVSQCQASLGFSSCPGSSNGGCCIPDYSCQGVGCVKTGYASTTVEATGPAVTVTVTPGQTTSSPTPASVQTPIITVTQTVQSGNTILITSTIEPASTRTVYTTVPVNTTVVVVQGSVPVGACSTGYQSCAASLGGGCCPTNRACGSSGLCPAHTSSSGVVPAVRPTSGGSSTTVTTTLDPGVQVCPTGFYMCSATYIGGCCQVGRNCDSTSCPFGASSTLAAAGATIVVPGDGGAATVNGAAETSTVVVSASTTPQSTLTAGQLYCANGWYGCGTNGGGGCCPSGYACGQSCTMTAAGQQGPGKVDKVPPAIAAAERTLRIWGWGLGLAAGVVGAGMVLL